MDHPLKQNELRDQEALSSARSGTFEQNLAYLHANIGYYLSLDVDQSNARLREIAATLAVLLEEQPVVACPNSIP